MEKKWDAEFNVLLHGFFLLQGFFRAIETMFCTSLTHFNNDMSDRDEHGENGAENDERDFGAAFFQGGVRKVAGQINPNSSASWYEDIVESPGTEGFSKGRGQSNQDKPKPTSNVIHEADAWDNRTEKHCEHAFDTLVVLLSNAINWKPKNSIDTNDLKAQIKRTKLMGLR